jgi:hypothetical protein
MIAPEPITLSDIDVYLEDLTAIALKNPRAVDFRDVSRVTVAKNSHLVMIIEFGPNDFAFAHS